MTSSPTEVPEQVWRLIILILILLKRKNCHSDRTRILLDTPTTEFGLNLLPSHHSFTGSLRRYRYLFPRMLLLLRDLLTESREIMWYLIIQA